MINSQSYSPFMMMHNDRLQKSAGNQIQGLLPVQVSLTYMEGQRSEEQTTLVQPAMRISLCFASL